MTTTKANADDELREVIQRIRDDPDAGEWAEWARRMLQGASPCRIPSLVEIKTDFPNNPHPRKCKEGV